MTPDAVASAVNVFADFLLRYVVALAGVGALAMALIEAWKKLFDTRTKYHLRAVLRWFGAHHAAYAELIHLTTGVDLAQERNLLVGKHERFSHARGSLPADYELSLFTLELERMMGHVQDAATIALRDWATFPALFAFLTAGARAEDVAAWKSDAFKPGAKLPPDESNRRAAIYARLTAIAKAKLDGFQLYTGFRWANGNQLMAIVVGAVVLGGALLWSSALSQNALSAGQIIFYCILSLLGGALSPIAKDLVVALKRVRTGG
jgi:hypothetical protein